MDQNYDLLIEMIRIIGLDPGLQQTGWGVIEEQNGTLFYKDSGVIRTVSSESLSNRLAHIYRELVR